MNEMVQRTQEIVHSVLKPHDADIADDCPPLLPQAWVRLGHLPAVQLRPISDDGDALRGNATTLHLHRPVRLVRGDYVVGVAQGEFLEHEERAVYQTVAAAV